MVMDESARASTAELDATPAPEAPDAGLEDRFLGCLLGLALADALGAGHEGGLAGSLSWKLAGGYSSGLLRWTDDTQMALGLARSLSERGGVDPDHLARTWAEGMEAWRGYGGGVRKLLLYVKRGADWREVSRCVFPEGSFGNGAAMRAAPIGLFYHRDAQGLRRAAEAASRITHAHPLGIEGGVLIARAVALALQCRERFDPAAFLTELHGFSEYAEYRSRLEIARAWLGREPSLADVRRKLGSSVVAHRSAVTAVYAFCRFPDDFLSMVRFICDLGGDTDTIGAMAGGIFGARLGREPLPPQPLGKLEARAEIEGLARRLYQLSVSLRSDR